MLVSAWLVFVGGMGRVLHLRISVASQNCVYGTFYLVRPFDLPAGGLVTCECRPHNKNSIDHTNYPLALLP